MCNNLGGCNCNKLHVIDKSNGVTIIVINWFRAHKKCYFTILPTKIWREFRKVANFNDVDIDVAHQITKKIASIMFVGLRKIHYNVMTRIMDMNEADILAGRAKSVSARHYAIYELDRISNAYAQAWANFGVTIG
jgi:intergrase/recombinase